MSSLFFCLLIRPPHSSTLFPYTTLFRSVGNRLLSLLAGVLYNTTLTDMETGYKAFRSDVLKSLDLREDRDRKSTRLNSSHRCISYAVFCLKKKNHKMVAVVFNYIESVRD